MGMIESRRQIGLLSLLFNSYFTKIGLATVSHLQPTLATGVDGGESDFLWRGSNSSCCFNFTTIEQDSVKEHLIKLGDVTNNDVLGFDSRLLFLSAEIIPPILNTKCHFRLEIILGHPYI